MVGPVYSVTRSVCTRLLPSLLMVSSCWHLCCTKQMSNFSFSFSLIKMPHTAMT